VSNVTPNQLIEAQKITNIVCVQNFYNVASRNDDEFIDQLAKQGWAIEDTAKGPRAKRAG